MADYNLKSIASDTDGPSADTELLFGSPDQSAGTPKSYSFAGIKTWIRSFVQAPIKTYVAGRYYTPLFYSSQNALAMTATHFRMFPFMVPQAIVVSELFVRINTVDAAGSFQCAIYGSDASTQMWTGSPLAKSAANASCAVAAVVNTALDTTPTLSPGNVYWMVMSTNSGTATFVATNFTPISWMLGDTLANVIPSNGQMIYGHYVTGRTFGTWSDLTGVATAGPLVAGSAPALVGFKVASIP